MKRIGAGEADGILCWQINRLSRNPIDSARIQWMLQQGMIKSILTSNKEYLPEDNTLLFSVETGMANQFLIDLSKNVKRGMQGKRERGEFPHRAPVGYLNDKAEKTIIKDPVRYPIIRQCFNLMLTGNYQIPQIVKIANSQWGYRSVETKKVPSRPMAYGTLYKVFSSVFYLGIIDMEGKHYRGTHEPLITQDEYDHIQKLLGRKTKANQKDEKLPIGFRGFLRCGECRCQITSEVKKGHTYYHCSHMKERQGGDRCTQRKCIREEKLEEIFANEIKKFTILPEFKDWAVDVLKSNHDQEVKDRTSIYSGLQNRAVDLQTQLDNLVKMLYSGRIDDGVSDREKNVLSNELTGIRNQLQQTEQRADNWIELAEKTFYFATFAHKAFIEGSIETKREIMMCLGYNLKLLNGELLIESSEWLVPILTDYPELEQKYLTPEPEEIASESTKKQALEPVLLSWQALVEDVRICFTILATD